MRATSFVAWLLALPATVLAGMVRRDDSTASSTITAPTTPSAVAAPTDACAIASSAATAVASAKPSQNPAIRPSLALNCLLSVPVDVERDLAMID